MYTRSLTVFEGRRDARTARTALDTAARAIRHAIDAGFRIGRRVRIGRVPGNVIGYNISNSGRFGGAAYPLLVETEFGITKCSMLEVSPA
ncbi:hypothetical protein [Thauera sp.]|jgi:hypothetical protein|uniref:hypothetical protein n=1 Tax=Thauera sp. TaxID=1905334 RepID=UPI002618AF5B|nr:hypothetical protein [Thauera sp.]MCK6410008.1 hypothetical protein [Thauera sp.]